LVLFGKEKERREKKKGRSITGWDRYHSTSLTEKGGSNCKRGRGERGGTIVGKRSISHPKTLARLEKKKGERPERAYSYGMEEGERRRKRTRAQGRARRPFLLLVVHPEKGRSHRFSSLMKGGEGNHIQA